MEDSRPVLNNSGDHHGGPTVEEHHCHDHAYFLASCDDCKRARAAFLPYHNIDLHPEKSTRSFQTNLGPSIIAPAISPEDRMKIAVTEGVISGMIRGLLELFVR